MNEPINWGVVASVGVPIVVAVVTGISYWFSHRTQKGEREHKIIDQLEGIMAERDQFWQAQIDADRKARQVAEAAMKVDIEELKKEQKRSQRRELIRDGYISQLRHHIDTNQGPPAPPWPTELYAD